MNILYIDTDTNKLYQSADMIREKLKLSRSKLNRIIFKLSKDEYVVWKNMNLFDEETVKKIESLSKTKRTKVYQKKNLLALSSEENRKKLYELLKSEFDNRES